MRKLLGLFLLLIFVPKAAAQTGEWWYGWDNETGVLAAYNFEGAYFPLLTLNQDIQPLAWRLDDERMLALLAVEDSLRLYELTPTQAIPFNLQLGAELVLPSLRRLVARQDPYLVLTAQEGAFEAGVLLNLEARTLEPLTGEAFELIPNWRFSADGQNLYYLSRLTRDAEEWNIWARNLSSGDELSLHNFASPFPNISVSEFGEQWIYTLLEESLFTHVVVNADGSTRFADQQTLTPNAAYRAYSLLGNTELRFLAPCGADCRFEQLDLDGNLLALYELESIRSPQVAALAELDANHLLVLIESEYWALDNTQASKLLGRYDAQKFLDSPLQALSPDSRWLLVSDGGAGFRLWDLQAYEIAAEGAAGPDFSVRYSPYGAVLSDSEQSQAFNFESRSMALLPHLENDFYTELLADGTVVYVQAVEMAGRPAGVYRYNPADGAFILMWQNMFPLLPQN